MASEIRSGQEAIVTSLLEHESSRYFQHDARHSAFKERCEQQVRNEDTIFTSAAFTHSTTENKNLKDESLDSHWDDCSLVSLTTSLPSSLSTDLPPSLFSYSSYETQKPCKHTAMSSTDVTNMEAEPSVKSCRVNIRNMSTYSWLGPNKFKRTNPTDFEDWKQVSAEEQRNKSVQDDTNNSNYTDADILDFSENDFLIESQEDFEENDVDYALEFNELKQLVKGCGFSSILDLHLNISKIIESTPVESGDCDTIKAELKAHYLSLVQQVFPWFLPEEPARYWREWEPGTQHGQSSQRDYLVRPPNSEHSYASRKRKASPDGDSHQFRHSQPIKTPSEPEDARRCLLCGVSGEEEDNTGRLLPFRYNEWLHLSCALWSSEVYETVDGSLQQVGSAVTRSRNLLCTVCHQRGATIGCCHPDCSANFHFLCGIQNKADFKEDKTVYCFKHAQKYASKENVANFEAERFIWIDADPEEEKSRPGKHKSKFVDYRNLKFSSGGLSIDSLGSLVLASDSEKVNIDIKSHLSSNYSLFQALIPVGFSATKSFWSALNPRKMTKYRCTTRYYFRTILHIPFPI